MKYTFTLLVVLFIPCALKAQSNYKPGYIVNTQNDTIRGFINYREWTKTPQEVEFKIDLSQASERFTPANTNAFAVSDLEYYEKFIVQVSKAGVDFPNIPKLADTTFTVDTVFLNVKAVGKNVSFYSYTDNVKTRYYVFDKNDKQIDELKYSAYTTDEDNFIKNINTYRIQLLKLLYKYQPGNSSLTLQIQKSLYQEQDLLRIIKVLNGNNEQQVTHKGVSGARWFAGIGVRHNTLIFNGRAEVFPDGTRKSSFSPTISGGIDYFLNKNIKKLIFRLELGVTQNQFNIIAIKPGKASFNPVLEQRLDFKQINITGAPQMIYNFYSADKLNAFVGAGIAINLFIYNDYNYYVIDKNPDYNEVKNKYPDFEKFVFSVPVKAGVIVNKNLEIYGTYWLPASMVRYKSYGANISAIQLGVNYLFGK